MKDAINMTIQDAIQEIDGLVHSAMAEYNTKDEEDTHDEEVLGVAVWAMKKQIPMKPIICGENPDGTNQFKCPECGRLWWEKSYITKYCDNCGNLIDRED